MHDQVVVSKLKAELAEIRAARDQAKYNSDNALAKAEAAYEEVQQRLKAATEESTGMRSRAEDAERSLAEEKQRSIKEKEQIMNELSERIKKVTEREAGMGTAMSKVR